MHASPLLLSSLPQVHHPFLGRNYYLQCPNLLDKLKKSDFTMSIIKPKKVVAYNAQCDPQNIMLTSFLPHDI